MRKRKKKKPAWPKLHLVGLQAMRDHLEWAYNRYGTVEKVAAAEEVSRSTIYRVIKRIEEAGLEAPRLMRKYERKIENDE